MIDRKKENYIGTYTKGNVVFYFYFDKKAYEDERKIATAIFNLKGIKKQVSNALLEQLHSELNAVCRTELVKEVFVDVSGVYYANDYAGNKRISYCHNANDTDVEINMDFYTDYLIKKEIKEGIVSNSYWGFCCCSTLGRFSRKDKKFREISNNMISKCEIM